MRDPDALPIPDGLTPAEWRVGEQARAGRSNAEIAVALGISMGAVEERLGTVLRTLRLADREQLRQWAPPEPPPRVPLPTPRWAPIAFAALLAAAIIVAVGVFTLDGSGGAEGPAASELLVSYTNRSPLPVARAGHTASVLADGTILIVGGFEPARGRPVPAVEAYDPGTDEFALITRRGTPRSGHTATVLLDGTVLVAGGGAPAVRATAEIYDLAVRLRQRVGDLRHPREHHAAVRLPDSRVLIVGGQTESDAPPAELYLPGRRAFVEAATPRHHRRAGHTATLLADGRVLLVGGRGPEGLVAEAEIYDPSRDRFEPAGRLAEARGWHTATLLADGRVLIAGGTTDGGTTGTIEIFDPATDVWSEAGLLVEPRRHHVAVLRDDRRIAFVGGDAPGWESEAYVGSVEIFDPQSGQQFLAAGLASSRAGHSATLLDDGRLLVVGGRGSDVADRSAERVAIEATTPLPVPPPPAITGITTGDGSLSVEWRQSPGDPDAARITGYEVQFPPSTERVITDASGRRATATGLLPGVYQVLVVAMTENRGRVVSGRSEGIQVFTRPGPITGLRASPASGGARLSWRPTSVDGGGITEYLVALTADGEPEVLADLPPNLASPSWIDFSVDGLTNGRTYHVAVTAVTPAGEGPTVTTDEGFTTSVGAEPSVVTVTPSAAYPSAHAGVSQPLLLPDGRVLFFGGNSVDVFDPESETFAPLGRVADPANGQPVLLPDGRVALVGGSQPVGGEFTWRPVGIVKIFDPETGGATEIAEIAPARAGWTVTLLEDGRLFVAGGIEHDHLPDNDPDPVSGETHLIDVKAGRIESGPNLVQPRANHSATLLRDGRVLLAGGIEAEAFEGPAILLSSVEIVDIAAGRSQEVGSLQEPRAWHSGMLLSNGSVLLYGTTQAWEIFNPEAGETRRLVNTEFDGWQVPLSEDEVLVLLRGRSDPPRGGVFVLNAVTSALRTLEPPPQEIYRPAVVDLGEGRILFADGIYDPLVSHDTPRILDLVDGDFRPLRSAEP